MDNMTEFLKEHVDQTVKKMVDRPEKVNVDVSVSTKSIIVQVKVDQTDCGKVIGKNGRTIDALKTISLAVKNTNFPDDPRKILLEVIEDEKTNFKKRKYLED